ncbi:hypothetical protein [Pseudoalteromonas sp. T1lg23B]|uniref:hypothetical protein n=1 Tax=Pseudoalteromonas sp. T1lg23B TaxID=2077097 RepID=UPI000CF61498|nr:hypothetical protein [Pseudoalteromonas sp. T1lg23B]
MKVNIKSFDVAMEVKQKGVELEVRSPDGNNFHGDCYVTMTGLVWCLGKTSKAQGTKIKWEELMEICGSKEKLKAALKAAKST